MTGHTNLGDLPTLTNDPTYLSVRMTKHPICINLTETFSILLSQFITHLIGRCRKISYLKRNQKYWSEADPEILKGVLKMI